MLFKNPETKRAYHREYMRRRQAAVKPGPEVVLIYTQEGPGAPRRLDKTRPYAIAGILGPPTWCKMATGSTPRPGSWWEKLDEGSRFELQSSNRDQIRTDIVR
jgi:hypothetical protein